METKDLILESYINQLKEHGTAPQSVYRFCKDLNLAEKEFFLLFSSFDAVESLYWSNQINDVLRAVQSGAEFATFSARQRFLTFGFAFLERMLAERSLFLIRFSKLSPTCRPAFLQDFENCFKDFAKTIINHGVQTQEIAERGRLSDFYPQGLYLLFRSLIDFNLKDQSPSFERTDAYWEKSVHLAFDLIRSQAIDSAFDLARFLIPSAVGAR